MASPAAPANLTLAASNVFFVRLSAEEEKRSWKRPSANPDYSFWAVLTRIQRRQEDDDHNSTVPHAL